MAVRAKKEADNMTQIWWTSSSVREGGRERWLENPAMEIDQREEREGG